MILFQKKLWLLFVLFLCLGSLYGQAGQRYTEEEVNIQKMFIEANREKLLRKYDNAAKLFEEVTKNDRKNPAPYFELAKVYDIMEERDKAVKNVKTAIRLDGDNIWYQIFLAQLYEKNDAYVEAATVFQQLVQKDPRNEDFYYQWAYFLVKSGQGDAAISVFDELEKNIGLTGDIAERRHRIYHELGKKKAAAREYAKLTERFPDNLDFKHQLARYYEQIGSRKSAKSIYEQIVSLNPEDAKARIALAAYQAKNQPNDLGYLETLKALFKDENVLLDVKVSKLYPYIQSIANEQDETTRQTILDLGRLLTETHYTAAKAFAIYGDLLYQVNDLEAALTQYKRTLEEDNTVFVVWENAMNIYYELGDFDGLLDFSEEAMDLFPNQGSAYYYYGLANLEKQNLSESIANFQLGLMMSGKEPLLAMDIFKSLSKVYSRQKQLDKALLAAEEGLKLNPNHAGLLEQYGDVLFQKGQEDAALKQWKKALDLIKKSPSLEQKIVNRSL